MILMSTLVCFTTLPMGLSKIDTNKPTIEHQQNNDLIADCGQSEAQRLTFDKMNKDAQRCVLQFCLEDEPIATAFGRIDLLKKVSMQFNSFFNENNLLKKVFLRCTFPAEYTDCQKKCLASYLAYITSNIPLNEISEADTTFIDSIQNKNELVALLAERLKSLTAQDKTISLEEANEGLINFLLYVGLGAKDINRSILQDAYMVLAELPATYPKGLVADRLYIINTLKDQRYNNSLENQGYNLILDGYQLIFNASSETESLNYKSLSKHRNKLRLKNPAIGDKEIITSLVESFSLDKKSEQLLFAAHEGDIAKIHHALQSGASTYDPFTIHLALLFTLSARHKECALLLFDNLPRVIISTQNHLLNTLGLISDSFTYAVKEEFYDIAQSLINRSKKMKIEEDNLSLNIVSLSLCLHMLSTVMTISKSREFCEKLLTPVFLKDFNIDLPGIDDDLIGEPLRKWLLGWFDNNQEVITNRDLLDQIGGNLNNLSLFYIFKPMILHMAAQNQLEFFKNMALLPGYKDLLLEMRSKLLKIARKNPSDLIEEILPKPAD